MTEPGPLAPPSGAADARLADLKRMIGKLGAPAQANAGSGGRLLSRDGGDGGLGTLFDLVDETVMARSLHLENGRGERMVLEVRNRRLLSAGHAGKADAPVPDAAETLTYAGAADLAALIGRLAAFSSAGALRVSSRPPAREARVEETGLSVAMLRAAALPPALPAASPPPEEAVAPPGAEAPAAPPAAVPSLRRFCAAISGLTDAWSLEAREGAPAAHGPAAHSARLAEALGLFASLANLGLSRPPTALLLAPADDDVAALALLVTGPEAAALAIRPGCEEAFLERVSAELLLPPAAAPFRSSP